MAAPHSRPAQGVAANSYSHTHARASHVIHSSRAIKYFLHRPEIIELNGTAVVYVSLEYALAFATVFVIPARTVTSDTVAWIRHHIGATASAFEVGQGEPPRRQSAEY